jgi:drug/metabolite transporter (DMT)-like permease
MSRPTDTRTGYVLSLAAPLIWATTGVIIKYLLDLYCGDARHDLDVVHEAISFEVVPADVVSPGLLPPRIAGPMFLPATFEVLPEFTLGDYKNLEVEVEALEQDRPLELGYKLGRQS